MVKCAICGFEGQDLSRHLRFIHDTSCDAYKAIYEGQLVVDSSVNQKRRETCEKVYGDPNYRNEEAKRLANEVFEGGHSLRDPNVQEKAKQAMLEKYGEPHYTNRKKAAQTCLEQYGNENFGSSEQAIKKRVNTLMKRYGRVINYDYVPPFTKEDLVDLHVNQGLTLGEMGLKYDLSAEGMGYWMKKFGIPVHKKVVIPKYKVFSTIRDSVEHFLKICQKQDKVLSFYDYGRLAGGKYMIKLKRAFNTGGRYSNLKVELLEVVLFPDKWPDFLKKLE